MKRLVKTLDEYASDLLVVASPKDMQKFLEHMKNGNRIYAIRLLNKYQLIKKSDKNVTNKKCY